MSVDPTEGAFAAQHGYYIDEISVGMQATFAKTLTDADLSAFASASGDTNPLHLNEEFAERTRFNGRIVHGMLTTSLWSTIVGTQLPGPGSAYMGQSIRFLKPVQVGETVTATLTVTAVDEDKQRIEFTTVCVVNNTQVATGEGLAWVPKRDT
ncbi:MAG: MaoC family dehydratase [Pseudomonadota bacterium]